MLLPQSSAFAALKNRLNSVSAIGFIHLPPRAYVPPFPNLPFLQTGKQSVSEALSTFQFQKRQASVSNDSHTRFSPTSSSTPTYNDRPNRLKGRDEGIKWTELLEKFRSVQDKARRAQRLGGDFDDGFTFGEARNAESGDQKAFKDMMRLPGPPLPAKEPPGTPGGSQAHIQAQTQKSKGGLSKFGRLGGGNRPKK